MSEWLDGVEREEWRPIAGYEGIYEVSNLGNIKSLERKITTRRGHTQTVPCRILTHKHSSGGVAAIDLAKDGSKTTIRVEELVAEAFLPKPIGNKRISHINGINSDVRACNLTWGDDENSDLPNEEWKPIPEFDGLYEVSNLGRVRSLPRRKCRGGIVKPTPSGNGYLKVVLSKNSTIYQRYVHRLVAEAFLDNSENLPEVNHKDEDKTNNCVSNLEWCTSLYNMMYGTRVERALETRRLHADELKVKAKEAAAKRDYSSLAKKFGKPVLQFDIDDTFVCWWPSLTSIGKKLGYSASNIRSACTRTNYYSRGIAYGYRWYFEEDYPCVV